MTDNTKFRPGLWLRFKLWLICLAIGKPDRGI